MNRLTGYVTITTISFISGILVMKDYSNGAMRESPLIAAKHLYDMDNQKQRVIFDVDSIQQLKSQGFVIFHNILTSEEIDNSRKDVMLMLNNETKLKFYDNGHDNESIRSDKVSWIAETIGESQHQYVLPSLLLVLRILRSIPESLLQNNFGTNSNLGVPYSNQLSIYFNTGTNYVAHLDKPNTNRTLYSRILQSGLHDRRYTIVLYLNSEQWTNKAINRDGDLVTDSGSLRITKLNGEVIDIEPRGGTVVIFDSSSILHEVRPNYGLDRIAITCWVGGSNSKNKWLRNLNIPIDEYNWKHIFGL